MNRLKGIINTIKSRITKQEVKVFVTLLIAVTVFLIVYLILSLTVPLVDPTTTCYTNQQKITTNILMYTAENEGVLPQKDVWEVIEIEKQDLQCPLAEKGTKNSYGYNIRLSGVALKSIEYTDRKILISDTTAKNNMISNIGDISPRHDNGFIVSFCDGHTSWGIKIIDEDMLNQKGSAIKAED